jgi:hypothetical protein
MSVLEEALELALREMKIVSAFVNPALQPGIKMNLTMAIKTAEKALNL